MPVSSDVTPTQGERAALVQAGVRVEYFTVAWMVVEAVVAIGAGCWQAASCSSLLAWIA
jgi:hypothetical protein